MKTLLLSVALSFALLAPKNGTAQGMEKVIEFLTIHPNKKAVKKDSSLYPAKAIFTPVISYAPETNWSFGVGMKGLFKMKNSGDETRTSNMPITFQYTLENKYFFFSGFDIFFPQEKYILTGNVRIQSFPSLFFGIGSDSPKTNEEQFGYSQILLEPIFVKKLFPSSKLFLGAGIRYNHISGVEVEPGGILDLSEQSGAKGSTAAGIQLAMIYDSRDNILNAKKGSYIRFTHGFYGTQLGGTQEFQLTRFDARSYSNPFKNESSVLAFQFLAHFSHGDTPLLEMGRLGGSDLMRGYFIGRYTDRHLIATQIEWRQKISHLWGIVVFAGAGSVAPSIEKFKFSSTRPSAGVGIRFLIDEHEDLNLRLDFAKGQEKSKYYFKIAEAF